MIAEEEWFEKFDPITVDFTSVRWLVERLPKNVLSKAAKPAQRSTCWQAFLALGV
jgi:hypothetical protein